MSIRFLQRQEIKVKTQDSRPRIHQAIYLRYRSFKRGGVSELSYAQSEDRSQATKLLTQAEDRDRDCFKSRFKPSLQCSTKLCPCETERARDGSVNILSLRTLRVFFE